MFEAEIAKEAQDDDRCLEFLEIFKELKRSIEAACRADPPPAYELARLRRLEGKVDALWGKLTDSQRSSLTQALLQRGLLAEQVGEIIRIFNGKLVRPR